MDEMCARCDATLRPGEEFCPQCGAPVVLRHVRPPRGRRGVVAAAVGGGTLISVLGVLLALVLLRPAPEPTAAESSAPSPSVTADVAPSTEPSSSPQQPDPSSTPLASEPPPSSGALTNRAVAEVAVAGLNLRREPGGGAEILGTLDEGARVFVIGAPQLVDGVAWYRVAVVGGPYSGCEQTYCPNDIGWVAEGGTGADAWLRPVAIDCPSSPMTAAELAVLLPLERLSCYGADNIVVTGTLDVCYCGMEVPMSYEPFWLATPISPFLFRGTFTFIRFEVVPPVDLEIGDVVRATLAMEHGAASTCVIRAVPDSPPAMEEPDRAETVLGCRTQLVMRHYEVIGFEDVSLPVD